MALLETILRPRAASYSEWDDFWYSDVGLTTGTGVTISETLAFNVSAVFRCISLLAQTVAKTPLKMYRRTPSGDREEAPDHPLWDLLHRQPNSWQTAYEFKSMLMVHLAMRGNFFARIVPGRRGAVDSLEPWHPDRVTVERLSSGVLSYVFQDPESGRRYRFHQDEVFHIRGLHSDGIVGLSPLSCMRESLGLALAAEQYAARTYSVDAVPRVVLTHPGQLSQQAKKNIRNAWDQVYGNSLVRGTSTVVLEEGVKLERLSFTPEEAALLGSRKFQIEEFARWFGVPLFLLMQTEKQTSWGTGLEQQATGFDLYTMLPHFVCIEQAILRDLIVAKRAYYAEFVIDGMRRTDVKSKYEAYSKALGGAPWMTRNEVRRRENLPALPEFDEPLDPANMARPSQQQEEGR